MGFVNEQHNAGDMSEEWWYEEEKGEKEGAIGRRWEN